MKYRIPTLFLMGTIILLLTSCSTNNQSTFRPLDKPVDIKNFINTAQVEGRETYIVSVLDQVNKGLIFIDSQRQSFIDFIQSDAAPMTIVPIGGNPVAMAVQEMTSTQKRVWVIENENNRLYAVDFFAGNQPSFEYVNLSANREGLYSRAVFENSGRSIVETLNQRPNVNDFLVDNNSSCQSWRAQYESKTQSYKVTSSLSGEQNSKVRENVSYTSDDGLHSFIIEPGSLNTTNGDRLTWFTCSAPYISLPSDAVDIHIVNNEAFILLNNSPSIEVFNLDTLSFTSSISIASAMTLKKANVQGDEWFIPDTEQNQLYRFDFNTQMVESIAVPSEVFSAARVDSDNLLLALAEEEKLLVYDTSGMSTAKEIFMEAFVLGLIDYTASGQNRILTYSRSGTVDAIDTSTLSRVDFNTSSSGKESSILDFNFFDSASLSQPEMIGLSTQDNVTLTESWQLIYEGTVNNLVNISASVAGNTLTVAGIDLLTSKLIPGDLITLESGMSSETLAVDQVVDSNTLNFTSNATLSGSVNFTAKSSASYIVRGSLSGEQDARVVENQAYTSDQGELTFLIRSSQSLPTNQGDFFSFRSNDGINSMDPADINLRSNIVNGLYFFNNLSNRNEAYLIQESTGRVLKINLDQNNLINTIL